MWFYSVDTHIRCWIQACLNLPFSGNSKTSPKRFFYSDFYSNPICNNCLFFSCSASFHRVYLWMTTDSLAQTVYSVFFSCETLQQTPFFCLHTQSCTSLCPDTPLGLLGRRPCKHSELHPSFLLHAISWDCPARNDSVIVSASSAKMLFPAMEHDWLWRTPPQKRGVALFSTALLFPPLTFVMGANTMKYSHSIYEKQLLNDL